jgi:hypothetical protein
MYCINDMAERYASAPIFDPAVEPAWRRLALESVRLAADVRKRLKIIEVAEDETYYPHVEHMFEDIRRGVFKVSTNNCVHPLWTPQENVAFRIVHDVLGHYPSKGEFNWDGEILACAAHRQHLSDPAARALETECIGQVAYALVHGGFGVQKVAFL